MALKVLSGELAADPIARKRCSAEAEARIQHPNVVNVTDFGAEESIPFIVMELLHGEDLGLRLQRAPEGLPVTEVADVLLAVCAGVFEANENGIVHRDLKPRNIFLAKVSRRERRSRSSTSASRR
jgi:serine/threonine protein kinase